MSIADANQDSTAHSAPGGPMACHLDGPVAVITMNHRPYNLMGMGFTEQLIDALHWVGESGARAAILRSGLAIDFFVAALVSVVVRLTRSGLVWRRPLGWLGRRAPPGRVFSPESAGELHKRLLDSPGSLAVVGGGLTGIELAAEIAETQPRWAVRLVTAGPVGAGLSGPGRDHVRRVLAARGAGLDEGHHVAGPDEVDADVVVWAASMTARTELAASAVLAMTGDRIAVGPALRSLSHAGIYAAGDAAASASPAAGRLRMACATALPTGAHAARAGLADLRGEEAPPLRFRFHIQCISLGRRDGLVQRVHASDSPRRQILTGPPAAAVKEQIVRSTLGALRLAVRHPGAAARIVGAS